ncbi:MAG: exo-alpha-sialidase [Ignavibacterium sp.]|jgi:hypothetical protein|uniref:T9SS type A sorting domain-containing protein n=1 Tax=Ignavibacterium sp. TaxID=2651167 RepID=UPI00329A5514
MKSIILFFIISINLIYAQHGTSPEWGNAVPIPKVNINSKQRGVLYNNIVTTSGGRIIVSTSEHNPSNLNQVYGYYLTYSDDKGQTWLNPPVRFTPIEMVTGGSSLKLSIDWNDNVYALWNSGNPSALFISRLDTNLNVIVDSVRVATKINYPINSTNITVDRYNRIHVMWNEGQTNSTNAAEVYYSRSTDNGNTWQSAQMLSVNDGNHSAFPHAQFDVAGDTLAIPWRDSVGGTNKWDVYLSVSTNGGATWSSSPIAVLTSNDSEWDPDLIIDPFNRLHLFYTVYPSSNPFNGARNYHKYSDDAGATWHFPNNPSNGMISDNYRSQLLEGTRYDIVNNVLYTTWKDERDFDFSTGEVHGDIMLNYSTDRGLTWSQPEFVTDLYDTTVAFKAGALLPTGEFCINYEILYPEDINLPTAFLSVYVKVRNPIVTEVSDKTGSVDNFTLLQNFPNPFNSQTKVIWQVPEASWQSIKVYDLLGKVVASLVDEYKEAGRKEIIFDAADLTSGIYFLKLVAGEYTFTKKMILNK